MRQRMRIVGPTLSVAAAAVVLAVLLAGCGGGGVDSGGLTAGDRNDAQAAFDALHTSNIPTQLLNLSATAGRVPAACRVHLASKNPSTFNVYIFWIPYVGPQSYTWLNMQITKDANRDKFHLGSAPAVLPGGVQLPGGQMVVAPLADYDTPLSKYGPQQDRRNRQFLLAHAGQTFQKPGARCQILRNGYLQLLPYK
jgi:hypothetical protein